MGTPQGATILVVDDDDAVTSTFERVLALHGYHVLTALNAEDALRQLDAGRPRAVLLDVRMPRVNGVALLYRIRSRDPFKQLPVLVITGIPLSDEMLDEITALDARVRYKPVTVGELLADVQQLLDSH
jgi:DNA-binding response OmpR family regulator